MSRRRRVTIKVRSVQQSIVRTFEKVPEDIPNVDLLKRVGAKFDIMDPRMLQLRFRGKFFVSAKRKQERGLEKYISKEGTKKGRDGKPTVKAIIIPIAKGGGSEEDVVILVLSFILYIKVE